MNPQSYMHTKDVYVQQSLDEMDTNKDGYVSEAEFIKDYAK